MRLPRRLRALSIAASIGFSIAVAGSLAKWAMDLGPYWTMLNSNDWRTGATGILTVVRNPMTINHISTGLGQLANVAVILLLIALSRHATNPNNTEMPTSKLLSAVTKAALVTWGAELIFRLAGVALVPHTYSLSEHSAIEASGPQVELAGLLIDAVLSVLAAVGCFVLFYVVYKVRVEPKSESHQLVIDPSGL